MGLISQEDLDRKAAENFQPITYIQVQASKRPADIKESIQPAGFVSGKALMMRPNRNEKGEVMREPLLDEKGNPVFGRSGSAITRVSYSNEPLIDKKGKPIKQTAPRIIGSIVSVTSRMKLKWQAKEDFKALDPNFNEKSLELRDTPDSERKFKMKADGTPEKNKQGGYVYDDKDVPSSQKEKHVIVRLMDETKDGKIDLFEMSIPVSNAFAYKVVGVLNALTYMQLPGGGDLSQVQLLFHMNTAEKGSKFTAQNGQVIQFDNDADFINLKVYEGENQKPRANIEPIYVDESGQLMLDPSFHFTATGEQTPEGIKALAEGKAATIKQPPLPKLFDVAKNKEVTDYGPRDKVTNQTLKALVSFFTPLTDNHNQTHVSTQSPEPKESVSLDEYEGGSVDDDGYVTGHDTPPGF